MRPGQAIDVDCYCTKGIGKTHAKWSPVATASYRLLPEIKFNEDIINEEADELIQKCPMKVFDIEDLSSTHRKAVVARPRNCTMCRECIRDTEWQKKIKLMRVKDHFIFQIESVGMLPPDEIFREAIKILISKVTTLQQALLQHAK